MRTSGLMELTEVLRGLTEVCRGLISHSRLLPPLRREHRIEEDSLVLRGFLEPYSHLELPRGFPPPSKGRFTTCPTCG